MGDTYSRSIVAGGCYDVGKRAPILVNRCSCNARQGMLAPTKTAQENALYRRHSHLIKAYLAPRHVSLDFVRGQLPYLRACILPVLVDDEDGGHAVARFSLVPLQVESQVSVICEDLV